MDMQKIMKQAQAMQKKMQESQDKIGGLEIEAESGGGVVKIVTNGKGEVKNINIDKEELNPGNKELLEDLIVAAFNNAKEIAEKKANDIMGESGISPDALKGMF